MQHPEETFRTARMKISVSHGFYADSNNTVAWTISKGDYRVTNARILCKICKLISDMYTFTGKGFGVWAQEADNSKLLI